jgi:hypothetical protein
MIVNPLSKHENEEWNFLFFSFLFCSLSNMKHGEEEKEEEGVIADRLCH